MRTRVFALASLVVTAALPAVLVRCGGTRTRNEAPHTGEATPASSTTAGSTSASASSETTSPTDTGGAGSVATATTAPSTAAPKAEYYEPVAPAPFTGAVPGNCAALDRGINQALSESACKADDDCTVGSRNCSCTTAISKKAASKLAAFNAAYEAKGCAQKLPPRPCATCPPPERPHCASGRCS